MRKTKELTLLDQAYNKFSSEHYISMRVYSGCEFGDHIDIECSCGWKIDTYGTATYIVQHVLESIYKEKE